MLNFNEKGDEHEQDLESTVTLDENNSSESFKMAVTPTTRLRSGSTSSSTSLSSSDDEFSMNEIPVKGKLDRGVYIVY